MEPINGKIYKQKDYTHDCFNWEKLAEVNNNRYEQVFEN